jgi:hypothetical protein
MAVKLWEQRASYDDVRVVFANTGQEHDDTLRFVDAVSRRFGFPVVLVEAVVDPRKGEGTKHRVVSAETASRWNNVDGPFAQVVAKYGLPTTSFPTCTRELKLRPIHSYVRSIGWATGSYDTAIGIRVDEIDRMSVRAAEDRIVYPLVKMGVRKQEVVAFFKDQHADIDLRIPERLGNCVWCWKKSFAKLRETAELEPHFFRVPAELERRFALVGPEPKKGPDGAGRRMFRGGRTVADILAMAPETANVAPPNACEESCEVDFSDNSSSD